MATGVAATDEQLAVAYFRQGCFDHWNGRKALESGGALANAMCVATAQFTQAVEKVLKSFVLLEVGRLAYQRSTHRVWSVDMQPEAMERRIWRADFRDGDLTKLRAQIQKALGGEQMMLLVSRLEALTPERDWARPNPEYPWVDSMGVVQVPAEYFDDPIIVKSYESVANAVLKRVAHSAPRLRSEHKSVSEYLKNLA